MTTVEQPGRFATLPDEETLAVRNKMMALDFATELQEMKAIAGSSSSDSLLASESSGP
jgi:hypothetical protein